MSVYRWMYASVTSLPATQLRTEVDKIVASSISRNAGLGVTGALLLADDRFAQYLEGPEKAVLELKASILGDPRHRDITTALLGNHDSRYFAGWALAYSGRSTFIAKKIAGVAAGDGGGVDQLVEVFIEFAGLDEMSRGVQTGPPR